MHACVEETDGRRDLPVYGLIALLLHERVCMASSHQQSIVATNIQHKSPLSYSAFKSCVMTSPPVGETL